MVKWVTLSLHANIYAASSWLIFLDKYFLVRVGWRDEEMRNRNLEMNSFEPET